jgi:hypothetical protein
VGDPHDRVGENVTLTRSRLVAAGRHLDWFGLFLAAWVAPLAYDATAGLHYFSSLLFWLVPTALLIPRFLHHTDKGGRRRRAFGLAVAQIVVLGVALDFVFGHVILTFLPRASGEYIGMIRGIPVEEILFYVTAPIAMLLVYAWCDEYWLAAYNASPLPLGLARGPLVRISGSALLLALSLEAAGLALKHHWDPDGPLFPQYYTFLVAGAFVPAFVFFQTVKTFVNWRAFGVTTLYVIVTSLVWEATLAIPRGWWGYNKAAMLGYYVQAWSSPGGVFPIEASLVWLCAPFSCILTYELVKLRQYRRNPDKPTFRAATP